MRKLVVLALVIAVSGGAYLWDWWAHKDTRVIGLQDYSRDARVETLGGLVAADKRFTVVHFWATWCAPCIVEMPNVLAALKTIPADVHVVMVNLDNPLPADFAAKWKVDLGTANPRWVNDPEQALSKAALGKVMLPTTLVVGASPTRILQQVDGPLDWKPLLEALR